MEKNPQEIEAHASAGNVAALHIRQARPDDEAALLEICLKTANLGKDASDAYSDPRLPGLVWATPYLHYAPELVFVVANQSRALGYVLGVTDTEAYNLWLSEEWWPRVRAELSGVECRTPKDREIFAYIKQEPGATIDAPEGYPAHMHIDLLPQVQSGGWGRKLVDKLKEALIEQGVSGLHLGVNPKNTSAVGFYKHIGFEMLDETGDLMGQKLK